MLIVAEKLGSFFKIHLQRSYNESIYLILKFLFRYVNQVNYLTIKSVSRGISRIMMKEITEVILILTVVSDFDGFG